MLIDLVSLKGKSHHEFEEEIIFKEEDLLKIDLLKEVLSCSIKVKVDLVSPYLIVKIHLDSELILYSSRSLKEVPYSLNEDDELTFLLEKIDVDEDEDVILIEGKELDLYPYIYTLFNGSIPFKVIAPDDKDEIKGDSWELITEDEYYRRKAKTNNPFSSLEGLFDDEE